MEREGTRSAPRAEGHDCPNRKSRTNRKSRLIPVTAAAASFGVLILGLLLFLVPTATGFLNAVVLLDRYLVALLNKFSQQSRGFDLFLYFVFENALLQGGVLGALFFGAWATTGETPVGRQKREALLLSLGGLYAAVLLALAARVVLPFRARPVVDPEISFLTPYLPAGLSLTPTSTSFPSGHATEYFAFPVALLAVSRLLGLLAFVYVLVVVNLPRLYFGLHYPTDILAGAVLTISTVVVVNAALRGRSLTRSLLAWSEKHAALFNGLLFLCCLEVAVGFSTVRQLLALISNVSLRRVVGF